MASNRTRTFNIGYMELELPLFAKDRQKHGLPVKDASPLPIHHMNILIIKINNNILGRIRRFRGRPLMGHGSMNRPM
jgi:hypothetical protein